MNQSIIQAILVTAAISFTVTTTSVFSFLREWVSKIHPKLEELIFCPWCFSHYVVFTILLTSNIKGIIVSSNIYYQFFFDAFTIIGGSGILHYILLRAYEPVTKLLVQRKIDKLKKNNVSN